MNTTLPLEELILLIDPHLQHPCIQLLDEHREKIESVPGSLTKHQAWSGGYKDHLEETMNCAVELYKLLNEKRSLH